jgi:hypothetical protein
MKHYNIEDQLADKLKHRTITPSSNAWERVAYNRENKSSHNSRSVWYWISASVTVAIGIITLMLLDTPAGTAPSPQVVIQQQDVKSGTDNHEAAVTTPLPGAVAVSGPAKHRSQSNSSLINTNPPALDSISMPVAAVQQVETEKANEIADALIEISKEKGVVTENDIDALLLAAQKDIALTRIKKQAVTTDEMALLKDAETEIDKSFREKTLDLFKHKFKTIKLALK